MLSLGAGPRFNIKMTSYQYKKFYDHLMSTMGFPILVRWHLYIQSGPRIHITTFHSRPEISFSSITSFQHFDSLVQDCSNSSASAMELLQSYIKASIWYKWYSSMVHKLPPCLIPHCYHFPPQYHAMQYADLTGPLPSLWPMSEQSGNLQGAKSPLLRPSPPH